MKSRITTYLLIAAVVAVWGFIAWKIFFTNPDKTPVTIRQIPDSKPQNSEEQPLLLDYSDPFLKNALAPKATVSSASRTIPKAVIAPPKKPTTPKAKPPITYTGTIKTGGRILYIFEYDGVQQMLSQGEELAGFRLAEGWQDSVRFTKDKEFFTLLSKK
jgi:hypothetical protein